MVVQTNYELDRSQQLPKPLRKKMISLVPPKCGVWAGEGAVSYVQELLQAPPEPEMGSGVHCTLLLCIVANHSLRGSQQRESCLPGAEIQQW